MLSFYLVVLSASLLIIQTVFFSYFVSAYRPFLVCAVYLSTKVLVHAKSLAKGILVAFGASAGSETRVLYYHFHGVSLADRICLPSTAPLRFRHGSGRRLPVGVRRWFTSPCTLPDPGASSSHGSALPRALGPLLRLQPRWRGRHHPTRANRSTGRLRGHGGSLRAGLRQVHSAGLPRGMQHGSIDRKSFYASAVCEFDSERCFALFVVAEEGVGRGSAGACEGAEEGAAHR